MTIGAGELVRGWELGLAGACEGERRRIMMNHDMAYGEVGAFRLIPPRVSAGLITLDFTDNDDTYYLGGSRAGRYNCQS